MPRLNSTFPMVLFSTDNLVYLVNLFSFFPFSCTFSIFHLAISGFALMGVAHDGACKIRVPRLVIGAAARSGGKNS